MPLSRVLMLVKEDPLKPTGGMGVHVRDLCNELCDDLEITVLCRDTKSQIGGHFAVSRDGIEEVDSNWRPTKGKWRALKVFNTNDLLFSGGTTYSDLVTYDVYMRNAAKFLANDDFDLIHIHDSHLWRVAQCISLLNDDIPVTMTSHLCFYFSHNTAPQSDGWMYVAQNETTALTQSAHLSTVSQSYAESLESLFMLPRGEVDVIGNGVDLAELDHAQYNQHLRDKFLGGRDKLAVFVGRLVPTKGVEMVLDAVEAMPECSFVLFASICQSLETVAPLAARIKTLVETRSNITWFNEDQELKLPLMKCADVGLVPSLHEPFGIIGLEWMGIETPLLTTAANGLADFCTRDNCTIHAPTSEGLIEAIGSHTPDLDKVLNARRTAEQHTWRKTADKVLNIYRKTCTY